MSAVGGSAAVVAHHYGSQLLDRNNTAKAEQAQTQRDEQITRVENKLDNVEKQVSELSNKVNGDQTIPSDDGQFLAHKFSSIKESKNSIENVMQNSTITEEQKSAVVESMNKMATDYEEIKKVLEKFIGGGSDGNKLFSDYFEVFYAYLDSLTLLEESALLHILLFIFLLLTCFNILVVFFGNEFIKYFDLENKYPKLHLFFKLRVTYQRYYLIWNIFLLFFVCISGICINLLVFY